MCDCDAGDEIVKWNGHVLQNKSADEVYDIIDESRLDAQVELVVSRPIGGSSATTAVSAGNCSSTVTSASNAATTSSAISMAARKLPSSTIASYIAGSAVVSSGGRYVQRKGISNFKFKSNRKLP